MKSQISHSESLLMIPIQHEAKSGLLLMIDLETLDDVHALIYPFQAAVSSFYHPSLNQFFVSLSNNSVMGYYSQKFSRKGFLLSTKKEPKRAKIDERDLALPELTPEDIQKLRERRQKLAE